MKLLLPGVAPAPEDPRFWKAVGVAKVEQDRAEWAPTRDELGRTSPEHEAFTRAHVEMLRDLGCNRQEVLAYASEFMNPRQVKKLADDLGSYGL